MKSGVKIINPKEKGKIIKKAKSFGHDFNLNQKLIDKIKILKSENTNKSIIFDCIKPNKRITTSFDKSRENSKNNNPKVSNFTKYNFSNLNNIRNIYLRNNNYFSTEVDHKYFNRSFNSILKEQNDKYVNNKYKNIRKALAPIYEIYVPSKMNKVKNIYNNYINMNTKQQKNFIKPLPINHNKYIRFRNKNTNQLSNYQKFMNYYPYLEKIKKFRANNSNDKIFMNRKFNNTNHKIIKYFNINKKNNSFYIYNSPFSKTSRNILSQEEENSRQSPKYIIINDVKKRKNKTTHYIPKENSKEIEIKKNYDYKFNHKKLSLRKDFGDNYQYFERNESPYKIDKTFHNRRSPVHVFGYENYFIIDETNDRLIASSIYNKKKLNRLNSEGNDMIKENCIFPIYKNY